MNWGMPDGVILDFTWLLEFTLEIDVPGFWLMNNLSRYMVVAIDFSVIYSFLIKYPLKPTIDNKLSLSDDSFLHALALT